jgi:hypothetical protein
VLWMVDYTRARALSTGTAACYNLLIAFHAREFLKMQRIASAVLVTAMVLAAPLSAAEVQGAFVKYDEPSKVLTVDVKGTRADYSLSDATRVTTIKGEPAKLGIKCFGNPRMAKPGAPLTVITVQRDGKDVVTEIKLGGKKK